MSIVYTCRHCGHVIGEFEREASRHTSNLDWTMLSNQDKEDMVHYNQNGDIYIKIICENCENTLKNHPEYHALDYFIQ